ncbi:MAG: major capsid protein, partial [Acidobacteriota bacterium]
YITTEEVTGGEQIVNRIQGEYAFNGGVKGFRCDITNGGANPDDTSLGTGSNWDKAVTSDKDLAGVVLKCHVN